MTLKKTALVTGGTRGIGLETALHLARIGCRVVITSRAESDAIQPALNALSELGANPIWCELSLEDLHSAQSLVDRVHQSVGPIDILVQNAVYQGALNQQLLANLHPEDLQQAWLSTITSPLLLIRAAHQHMERHAEQGRILIVGSGAGRYDPPASVADGGWGFVYGASKAALHRLAGVMQAEHPTARTTLITVNPGVVDTPALRATLGLNAELVLRMGAKPASDVGLALAWLATNAPREQWHLEFVDLQKRRWEGSERGLV